MLTDHPELLDGLFNRGNQADGRQQQALAGSIAAFAGYLVNTPDQLPDHLLSRISHKHVSLGRWWSGSRKRTTSSPSSSHASMSAR